MPEIESRPSGRRPLRLALLGLGIVAVVVCAVIVVRSIGGGSSPEAEAAYQRGVAAFHSGKLDDAFIELEKAKTLGYPDPPLERVVGLILSTSQQFEQAEPLLVRTVQRSSETDPEVAEALARIYLNTFRLDLALPLLEKWAAVSTQDPKPLIWLAEAEIRRAVPPRTILSRYQEAVKRDPSSRAAQLGLADQWHVLGDEKQALQAYLAFVETHPEAKDPLAFLGLGRAYQTLGDETKAIDALQRVLAINPNQTEALTRLARILLHHQKASEALALAERACKIDPFDPENRYIRATVYSQLGRKAEAATEQEATRKLKLENDQFNALKRQLAEHAKDPDLMLQASLWLFEHGKKDEAADWAKMVVAQRPTQPEANRLLADYYQARGEVGLANSYRLRGAK